MLDKKIEYFITVVQEGSFSAASRKLFLSQANLSKQVTLLESELGVKLLDRDGYRPVLTDAGELFYREAVKIREQCVRLQNQIWQMEKQNIVVGFTGAFENREIIKAVNAFKRENRMFEVSFLKFGFEESVKNLLDENIDISFGIESSYRHYENIQYDILYNYEICLICSFDHPFASFDSVSVEQVKKEKMILLSRKFGNDFYKDFMDACRLDGFKPKIGKEVDSMDELIFEVSIGNGIAIVSKDVIRENEVKILNLNGTHHASNYVIAHLRKDTKPIVLNFIDYIKAYFQTL